MFVIANNITTRKPEIDQLFWRPKAMVWPHEQLPGTVLKDLARRLIDAGADAIEINVQQHHDRPQVMEFFVRTVQEVADCQLCLSSNNPEALEAGLRACKRPAIVNYVAIDEERLGGILPLVSLYNADVILLVTDPEMPGDATDMLKRAAILVGAANEIGIPNDRIIIDPGILHITSDIGARHLVEVMELLRAIPETFDPPVRTTCWISNISIGVARRLRSVIDTSLLAMLAGLGLSSVFMDALNRENMRMVRMVEILRNRTIYSDREIEL